MIRRFLLRANPQRHLRTACASFSTSPYRSLLPDIDENQLHVTKTTKPKTKLPNKELKFGASFTDHMLEVDWNNTDGWGEPRIVPFHNLDLHPAASSLHYALQAFEGMKAYMDAEGRARLFRPLKNMERMNNSAAVLCMPTFNSEELLKCIKALVAVEKSWIPREKGYSLYIRPTIISTEPMLGVMPPKNIKIFVIMSPVGPYYPTGFAPVKLLADPKNVRAWPGGTGHVKAGGNYAPSILPMLEASAVGCQQVLWLFGDTLEVTEVGTMNQFFAMYNKDGEKEIITAPLDGTILPGVTRDSILELLKDEGEYKVVERTYTLTEIIDAINEKRMIEAFGCGTAAIVSPVKGIRYLDKDYEIPLDPSDPNGTAGVLTKHLFERIMRIQYGEESFKDWSVIVDHPGTGK